MKNIPVKQLKKAIDKLPDPERFNVNPLLMTINDFKIKLSQPSKDDVIELIFYKSTDGKEWELSDIR